MEEVCPGKFAIMSNDTSAWTGIFGFLLAIFYTLIALFALVRFWMFTHIAYTIFTISMLIIGICVMISAIIVTCSINQERKYTRIILYGVGLGITWNLLSIFVWLYEKEFYQNLDSGKFLASTDFMFYNSLAMDDNNSEHGKNHPFFVGLKQKHLFFDNEIYKIITLTSMAVIQIIYFIWTILYYLKMNSKKNTSKV